MTARILVVAEDQALRTLLERVLEGASLQVKALTPAGDVVDEAHAFAPDVVLIDMSPRDGHALQAVAKLRGARAGVPVLFMGTGRESVQNAADARTHGGDDFVQRPLPVEKLLERLARHAQIETPVPADPTTIIPGPAVRLAELAGPPVELAGQRPSFTAWGSSSPAPRPSPAAHRPVPAVEPAHGAWNVSLPGIVHQVRLLAPTQGHHPEGSVPALLWACAQQHVTGRLDLSTEIGGDVDRSLFFEDGQVLALRSRLTADRFEEHLLNLGFLTPAQASQAKARGILSPRRAAAVLLEEGLLKAQEVFVLAREHLKDRVMALMERSSGAFHFVADTVPEGERIAPDESLPALTWRGIRRKFPLDRLMPLIGGPSTLLTPVTSVDLGDFSLDATALRALGAVDGAHTLEDIAASMALPLELVYQVAFLLLSVGATRLAARGTDTPAAAEAHLRDAEIDRARVAEQLRRCRDCNYFDMLGLAPVASRSELELALDDLARRFDGARFADPGFEDLRDALREIRSVVAEARGVLMEDGLRARYRASLLASA